MPRKTPPCVVAAVGRVAASMRPRPDAAENLPTRRPGPFAVWVASMRPRPDAAENRAARAFRPHFVWLQ